ncbi:hypothetical protein BCR36DRAFT_185211 [Piromyces finnis]|uniref:Uncharacterized protein n=1 Tax=Piromyces finnis TaxID=1754191 RepID=A0A1Y1VH84_9FUNG|nr:hypothetical protein BCR36DRAFT_185211 [Piromyces finnis]|eukprot:ORX55382.1 hypothetical protein BCR36DRAFT_185211 [Piromyces finnis]
MSSIKSLSIATTKKNSKIFKKAKHFFTKRKSSHRDSLNLDNSISYISNKEDSNRTLNTVHENDSDVSCLKQNKPILSSISLDEKSTLSENSEIINTNTDKDLYMKINNINNLFKNMNCEWHSTNAEFSERLNCLLWQINQFQKEQTESSQNVINDIHKIKEDINTNFKKTNDLNEEFEQIKKNYEILIKKDDTYKKNADESYIKQQSELQTLNLKYENLNSNYKNIKDDLNNKMEIFEKNSENLNKIMKKEYEEKLISQSSELKIINYKLEHIQTEFEQLKEKISLFNENASYKENFPRKFDINSCDNNLIEYITKIVNEKIEQFNKINKSESTIVNNLNIKVNELNEKLDEFQIYQLSREVEWYQMKLKLEETMCRINERFNQLNDEKDNKIIEKLNNENDKLKETQENINNSVLELQSTLNDIKTNIFETLNKQQNSIDNIITTELLHVNDNEVKNSIRTINDINAKKDMDIIIADNINKINRTIISLSDDIKALDMETKITTTNISLLWEDIRSVKNFIDQYNLNEKFREKEQIEEYTDIRNEINNIKKIINGL